MAGVESISIERNVKDAFACAGEWNFACIVQGHGLFSPPALSVKNDASNFIGHKAKGIVIDFNSVNLFYSMLCSFIR